MTTYIIAEAGVNHNGSLSMAKKLIDNAAIAGADAVKFQTFKAEDLLTKSAPKAEYQKKNTSADESQFEMLKKLEINYDDYFTLMEHAKGCGIEFLSTPFDSKSLHFLCNELKLTTIKISSGDITNAPFLLDIARCAQQIILSTGMSSLADVEAALGVFAFGLTTNDKNPQNINCFREAFASHTGQQKLKEQVTILHCTSEYPAKFEEVNLKAMDTLATAFGLRTGYSDHTNGIHIPTAAVARGATVIEKHFTLDNTLPGPDHKASLEPQALKQMVSDIRDIEKALGDGVKRPFPVEWQTRLIARKSLVAAQKTKIGEPLKIACKRPGNGVSPFEYWSLAETSARKNYDVDELLEI